MVYAHEGNAVQTGWLKRQLSVFGDASELQPSKFQTVLLFFLHGLTPSPESSPQVSFSLTPIFLCPNALELPMRKCSTLGCQDTLCFLPEALHSPNTFMHKKDVDTGLINVYQTMFPIFGTTSCQTSTNWWASQTVCYTHWIISEDFLAHRQCQVHAVSFFSRACSTLLGSSRSFCCFHQMYTDEWPQFEHSYCPPPVWESFSLLFSCIYVFPLVQKKNLACMTSATLLLIAAYCFVIWICC